MKKNRLAVFANHAGLPFVILLGAACFLGFLLSMVQPGVFFSGDGGLKYLIAKQLAGSGEFKVIESAHPQWVQQLWQEGFSPFSTPFVYEAEGKQMVAFPVFFQMLNSFFYHNFGYKGIYIIPAVSVLFTWLGFLGLLYRMPLANFVRVIGIALLAFCTPLTFYGAVYWEHALAVLLSFNAFIYFVHPVRTPVNAVTSGLLAGMCIWFREEAVVLVGIVLIMLAWNNRKKIKRPDILFLLATVLPIAVYFIFNITVYGSFFGLHGTQVMGDASVSGQLEKGVRLFFRLNKLLLVYFPLIAVLFAAWIYSVIKQEKKWDMKFQVGLMVFAYLLLVPFLLPSDGDKQWGPRFFLPVVPPAVLALCLYIDFFRKKITYPLIAFGIVIIAYSAYLHIIAGSVHLHQDYSDRVYPALQYIQQHSISNIIVDNQYISQELTELYPTHNFFLITDSAQTNKLMTSLKNAGQTSCIVVHTIQDISNIPDSINKHAGIQWNDVGSYRLGVLRLQ